MAVSRRLTPAWLPVLLLLLAAGCGGGPAASSSAPAAGESAASPPAVSQPVSQTPEDPAPAASDPASAEPAAPAPLAGMVICVDPGHGVTDAHGQEAVSPLSDEQKAAYVSGAAGDQITEEALNLQVALRLRDTLTGLGADVLLTRETNAATVSNIERAEMANNAGADCCIRIHADGIEDRSVHGVSVLVPAGDLLGTPAIVQPSRALGQLMVDAVAAQTGASNRGLSERADLTGFNWSKVPCVLLEMGFVTNPDEEAAMMRPDYQQKIVDGIALAVQQWRAASP